MWVGAKLTVTFDDGRTVSVLKGTDSCASFTFGSWNTAMVSDSENRQFWQMFGVPLTNKQSGKATPMGWLFYAYTVSQPW